MDLFEAAKMRLAAQAASPQIYTVRELNLRARTDLERAYSGICIEAEISGVSPSSAGHVYFELVDKDGAAKISAVMWRGTAQRYRSRLRNGRGVRAIGQLTVYEKTGRYQFIVSSISEDSAGLKAEALRKLTAQLDAEGLFDVSRKRPLPTMPACVGVVTSRTGAALQDIIKVARRRFPVKLLLIHAAVQGETAPAELRAALDRLGQTPGVDVIIIGRGGGSTEELDAFNDEALVRAVAACPVPVISAVGHQIDITLCDRAADKRAATPSEAAELAIPDKVEQLRHLQSQRERLVRIAEHFVLQGQQRHTYQFSRLQTADPRHRLDLQCAALQRHRDKLEHWAQQATPQRQERLNALRMRLHHWGQQATPQRQERLNALRMGLHALHPQHTLKRGFAAVSTKTQRVVTRAADLRPDDIVRVQLAEGHFDAVVVDTYTATDAAPKRRGIS